MGVSLLQMRLSALVLVCMSAVTLPAQQIGTAGRLQDLDFARTQLPQLDPFFFAQLDPARFQAAADALSASAPAMTDTDFYVGLAQLIAMAGDPHTSLFLTGAAAVNAGFHRFPLSMHWLDDGVFVTGASDPYSRALGTKLVRVGNVPIEQVVARLATVIPHVNDQWVHYMAQQYLTVPALLQGLGVVPAGPTSSLTFQTLAGDVFTMDVAPADTAPQSFVPALSAGPWLPRYLQGSRLNYWLKYEAANRLLYFKYNSCVDMAGYSFSTFASDLLTALDSNPVDTLVLDFRGNMGGNSALFSSLTGGLAARMPALAANPNFRAYDVVDKATISSGLSAAMSLKDPQINRNGVLRVIGEPTGGAGQGYGNAAAFTLPASNLTGQYATKFIPRPTYISSVDSFLPDIAVQVRSTDYFARYDPVMGRILARMDYPPYEPSGAVIALNAASFRSEQGLAPGAFASAFGNFGTSPDQVLMAGLAGQIIAATPTQVNFIVPAAVTPGPASISVRAAGTDLGTGQATIVAASLGIFVLQPGDPSQPGAVENQDSSVNQDANPAVIGSVIQIFATGYVTDRNAVQVFFMDTPAQITYSGPVAPGLWQINAQVPATASGQVPVFVVAGGIPSNAVTVWVQ